MSASVVSAGAARTVAVVIPCCREHPKRVAHTVHSALQIRLINLVVLVNDGGPEAVLDELVAMFNQGAPQPFSVIVIHLPENRGPAAAMNVGVGFLPDDAIVCRLDVGDAFLRDAKERQIAEVAAGVSASFSPHLDLVERETFTPPANWPRRIYTDGVFCICTAVFERRVWASVDGFDESLRYGDDWDFTMRVHHAIGWHQYHEVTCEAGAFADGHTKRADRVPELAARKTADTLRVLERGQVLSHPESMKHLSNPKFLRKRGRL